MSEVRGLLLIESPLHGQVQVPLRQTFTVGSSIESDIVLADVALAPSHLRLGTDDTLDIWLEALEGDILLDEGKCLSPGMSLVLRRTTHFSVGKVPFRVELSGIEEMPAPVLKRRSRISTTSAILLAGICGFCAFATTEGSSVSAHALSLGMLSSKPVLTQAEQQISKPLSHPQVLAELHRLNLDAVTLDSLGDGALRATGTISETERPQWAEFKTWVDSQSSGKLVLVDAVANDGKLPKLAIQSAWLGDVPYIIDGSGDKLFVGANIGDGWTIGSIEPGRVNVSRARRHASIRF